MSKRIKLLDCTLRDGAYINKSQFGEPAIRGIINKLYEANVDIIECGWLKNDEYKSGSTYFHVPDDIRNHLAGKDSNTIYAAMIDWDRYNINNLPQNDGQTIDAIRVVFPYGKHKQAIKIGRDIRKKGYEVMFQAANTLAYNDTSLKELAECMNEFMPASLSIVDTFGAMHFDDLEHIIDILNKELDNDISLGFHAHNNQQLAFALCIHFLKELLDTNRTLIVDSSLNGMGRGAGNATTELVANFINHRHHGNYDMNAIMDVIDIYINGLCEKYIWGYSTSYFIAGIYQCHVNNITYLLENHRTNAKDMRTIIESLSQEERRRYDYNLLEDKYLENQGRSVDDKEAFKKLQSAFMNRKVVLIAPGKSIDINELQIKDFISKEESVVIGVNAIDTKYKYDYLFFTNSIRYEYAKLTYPTQFANTKRIILSNIKTVNDDNELIINFNLVVKRGWSHFDNAVILCLRLMNKLNVHDISIAGFDGFKNRYDENYSDENLPTLNSENRWEELNEEIKDMFTNFKKSVGGIINISFITDSIFE